MGNIHPAQEIKGDMEKVRISPEVGSFLYRILKVRETIELFDDSHTTDRNYLFVARLTGSPDGVATRFTVCRRHIDVDPDKLRIHRDESGVKDDLMIVILDGIYCEEDLARSVFPMLKTLTYNG